MLAKLRPGTVIIDLAAERGGNCALTKPGERVDHNGVVILGPLNIAAQTPQHASQMYSKNITTFLQHLIKEGQLTIDQEDEITAGTLVGTGGAITHPMVKEKLGE